jgi:hypothetical protein
LNIYEWYGKRLHFATNPEVIDTAKLFYRIRKLQVNRLRRAALHPEKYSSWTSREIRSNCRDQKGGVPMGRGFDESEIVSQKIWNPGTETFMTQGEFDAYLKREGANITESIEKAYAAVPERLAAKAKKKEERLVKKELLNFKGKTLWPNVKENPRGKKSDKADWKSSDIILNNPGITFEKFIELGGRECDLRWDISPKRNWTTIKKADGSAIVAEVKTEAKTAECPNIPTAEDTPANEVSEG